jgi:hypothetical protein
MKTSSKVLKTIEINKNNEIIDISLSLIRYKMLVPYLRVLIYAFSYRFENYKFCVTGDFTIFIFGKPTSQV